MLHPTTQSSPSLEIFPQDFASLTGAYCFSLAIASVKASLKVAFTLKSCFESRNSDQGRKVSFSHLSLSGNASAIYIEVPELRTLMEILSSKRQNFCSSVLVLIQMNISNYWSQNQSHASYLR